MVTNADGDRTRHFPAIEKKHGLPVSHWLDLLAEMDGAKYPEQISCLREEHGFSQAHANAIVMYARGSSTSRRFANPKTYFASLPPVAARTARSIFSSVTAVHADMDLVIAWNQPMLRTERGYVIGLSASTNHLTINPFSDKALAACSSRLKGLRVNKKTFVVPLDWSVDADLLLRLVKVRLAELK